MKYLVFDTETTGLSPVTDEITQLAYIVVDTDTDEVVKTFNHFVLGEVEIPLKLVQLTGITNEIRRQDGILFDEAMKELQKDLNSCQIAVAHNASFDVGMIGDGADFSDIDIIDTLAMARGYLSLPKNRLCDLIDYYDIHIDGALHNALTDVLNLNEVFKAMREDHIPLVSL